MFIEDLIRQVSNMCSYCLPLDDRKLMSSLARRIEDDIPVTSRQAYAAEKILRRTLEQVAAHIPDAKSYFSPVEWRNAPVPSRVTATEARHVKGNIVALRCNTSPEYRDALKELKAAYAGYGVNLVTVTDRKSLDSLIALLGQERFHLDLKLETYLAESLFCAGERISITDWNDILRIEAPCHNAFAEFCNQVLGLEE